MKTQLTEMLNIEFPIIMAPMFLVTNELMMIEAMNAGIAACIPALNYRDVDELEKSLNKIRNQTTKGSLGVNLIVNKSNIHWKKQLEVCLKSKVDFFITSLGNPKEVIEASKKAGVKVLCDVVDLEFALKVEQLGADAIIAVNSGAGGHAGKIPTSILVPMLKNKCKIPIVNAGGVATGEGLLSILSLGAEGASIGSPFIASTESSVSDGYKKAVVDYGANDIVLTTKISGTPCTVINTPYVAQIGTEQNFVESFLNKNKQLKKYAKMLTYYKGMKLLEKAAFSASYKSVWCAGPSIEFVEKVQPIKNIINDLKVDFQKAKEQFIKKLNSY